MRLLYVIPYYRPALAFGGPVTVCAALAEAMVRRGHEVRVLTTDAASRSERFACRGETLEGVQVERLRNASQRAVSTNLFLPLGAKPALRRLAGWADVVHVHEFFTWLDHRGATAAAALHKPVLLSPHGSLSLSAERGRTPMKTAWLAAIGRRTIAACNLVQVATDYEAAQCLAAGVPERALHIIPQGVTPPPRSGDAERFRSRWQLPSGPMFLFAGRLRASKGVDLLLQVAAELASHPLAPTFVLAGAEENRPDLSPGRRATNLLLTGPLTRADLDDAYAAADVFVLPSFAEGLPMVALDALAFGVPVVLSRACNLPEVEAEGVGVLVDTHAQSLRAGIEAMLGRRSQWAAMGERGKALVRARYAEPDILTRYEDVYEELRHG